ncbi:MAG: hypothetical protein LBI03_04875 [Clostridiales bacterium]|jgi:hypothetical protein|nr:hypothetical protein [Clostridiales bacterium]
MKLIMSYVLFGLKIIFIVFGIAFMLTPILVLIFYFLLSDVYWAKLFIIDGVFPFGKLGTDPLNAMFYSGILFFIGLLEYMLAVWLGYIGKNLKLRALAKPILKKIKKEQEEFPAIETITIENIYKNIR